MQDTRRATANMVEAGLQGITKAATTAMTAVMDGQLQSTIKDVLQPVTRQAAAIYGMLQKAFPEIKTAMETQRGEIKNMLLGHSSPCRMRNCRHWKSCWSLSKTSWDVSWTRPGSQETMPLKWEKE